MSSVPFPPGFTTDPFGKVYPNVVGDPKNFIALNTKDWSLSGINERGGFTSLPSLAPTFGALAGASRHSIDIGDAILFWTIHYFPCYNPVFV